MIKIVDVVRDILLDDEEALFAFSKGFINLSGYAKCIQKDVERKTKKKVRIPSIVVALSRLQRKLRGVHPMVVDVVLQSSNTKSPITELVYEKTDSMVDKIGSIARTIHTTADDFLTITMSTHEVGVLCSDRILKDVKKHFKRLPRAEVRDLAILSLTIDPSQYARPNITFSLLRRIARKRIVLAETISTYSEIIFAFHQSDLSKMIELFSIKRATVE